ncbi:MAG TPA: response regulator [Pyrinomonadaceae bacterium]|jgi:CheY-like chemotaxis protein
MAGLTIIVLVDGEEIYSGTGLLLEKRGYRVVEAVTDAKAVEIVRRERPDMLLMDTDLPPAKSLVVARGLRERAGLHDLTIIVVTSQKMPRLIGDSAAVGHNDYVVRQGDFEQLKKILNHLSLETSSLVATETGGE